MKKHLSTIIFVLIFLTGLSLLLYPTVSDYINSLHQSQAIASYAESVAKLEIEDYKKMWDEAVEYNQKLASGNFDLTPSEKEIAEYNRVLDVTGTGIMAYIEIPKINCSLPIYQGTDEKVLQTSIGHIAGTSLPVDGENTHCVLSGHRGLPSAKLFTDIDKLDVGDEFMIKTLDEVLTYRVDRVLIVLPQEVESLMITPGQNLCTLVTCTPYGINTHRLLVRGHRVETNNNQIRVTADATQVEPMMVAGVIAVPLAIALVVYLFTRKKRGE